MKRGILNLPAGRAIEYQPLGSATAVNLELSEVRTNMSFAPGMALQYVPPYPHSRTVPCTSPRGPSAFSRKRPDTPVARQTAEAASNGKMCRRFNRNGKVGPGRAKGAQAA